MNFFAGLTPRQRVLRHWFEGIVAESGHVPMTVEGLP